MATRRRRFARRTSLEGQPATRSEQPSTRGQRRKPRYHRGGDYCRSGRSSSDAVGMQHRMAALDSFLAQRYAKCAYHGLQEQTANGRRCGTVHSELV